MEEIIRNQLISTGKSSKIVAICALDFYKRLCASIEKGVKEFKYEHQETYFLEIPKGVYTKSNMGCVGHPNNEGHRIIANHLE